MLPLSVSAQTITVGPIAKALYCVGDSLTVAYQTTGSFNADNQFKYQVSDANGSFANFTSFGSETALTGSFTFALHSAGAHYRVRVIATDPYIASADNGRDLQVFDLPTPAAIWPPASGATAYVGTVDDTITLGDWNDHQSGLTYNWNFGQDANISTSSDATPRIRYSSPGIKPVTLTVTNEAGCASSVSFFIGILSCNPQIPADARVVTGTETGSYPAVWVKAGGNFTAAFHIPASTVFAEPGSSVSGFGTFYIKQGASYSGADGILVFAGEGASRDSVFYCNDLQFDYSQVSHAGVSSSDASTLQVVMLPNRVSCYSSKNISATVCSLVGDEVTSSLGQENLDIDLTSLPAGVYFAVVESGDERVVKRIAVVH